MSSDPPTQDVEGDGSSECVICFTPYDNLFHLPKILSCQHVFCLECLSRITVGSSEPNSLPCPICRLPTVLPSKKGPPALSTDNNLLRKVTKPPSSPTPSVRFSRKRGLLYVQNTNPLHLSTISLSVDLGRPPPGPHSARNLRSLLRGGGYIFYGSIGAAILLTIALVLAGVYIFYLVPWNMSNTGASGGGHGISNGTVGIGNTTTSPKNL
ncbi:RING finger protein 225 isoform 1-T2 [Rhinophrynus dorsalis]